MAAALDYVPPSTDPFDRISDIDAPLDLDTDDGGVTAIVARDGDRLALTSITAWRWWNWAVNNDADFTRLSIRPVQRIPSRQDQWSQELRVAATGDRLDYVAGLYAFRQEITGEQTSTWGPQATFWLLGPAPGFAPKLLDGYALSARSRFVALTTALFGEGTWRAADGLALTLGLRQSWERKDGDYASSVAGGAVPRNTAEANAKLSIARGQSYRARLSDSALTGRANVAWTIRPGLMVYAQHAVGEKSGGINMSGLPLDAANNPALTTAVIKPEQVRSSEVGLKSAWLDGRLTVNLAAYAVRVHDFQTNVVDTGPGALRGYLANIGRVTSDGAELDAAWAQGATSARLSLAWTDARYGRFPNGGCPLEAIAGGTQVCDLTGRRLSGVPEWAVSGGFDHAWALAALGGDGFIRLDASWRSAVNGEATGSRFTKIDGYGLANMSVGLRRRDGLELSLFVRNLTDARYLTNVTVQQGNSGLVLGAPGEPRLIGVRLSVTRDGAPG
jgi:iron complex outermembrane receptor protein